MPVVTPDTSQSEDFSQPIAPGTYRARIVECSVGKSKAGNNKIVPKFKIMVDGTERTRSTHLVIEGEGASGFDQLIRAAGFLKLAEAYKDPNVKPKPAFDTDQLLQQEVMVIVEEDLYTPPGGSERKQDKIVGYLKV